MKKIISTTLLALLTLTVVACGFNDRRNGPGPGPGPMQGPGYGQQGPGYGQPGYGQQGGLSGNYYNCQTGQFPCQYVQSESHCTTGNQVFQSREQYCQGLRNETLNNRCAMNWRYESFRNYCSNYSWQTPPQPY